MLALRIALLLCVCLLFGGSANGAATTTYYVSATGDDARAGTSPATAWRTLAKVNNTRLQPGDSVLLEGGKTFTGPLVPWGSGVDGQPVTFGSYGQGRATISNTTNNIVFLHGVSYVTIQNLRLTADGADMHVIVSDPKTASAFITIKNDLIENTAAFGINSPSFADHDWVIQGNTVRNTGETGITFRGSGFHVLGNLVQLTGRAPSEAAHGVYAKGPNAEVIGNVIDGFDSSGVSVRYQGSTVRGNLISNGKIGVSYFQEASTQPGTITIAYNRIYNVNVGGIFLDDSSVSGFVIANNTIAMTNGNGLNLHRVKALTLVNNLVTGIFDRYAVILRKPAGTYVERHNLWFNGGVLADAKGGVGNLSADPKLDTRLVPRKGSPAIDAGVSPAWLGYRKACDGAAFHYCGKAPDIGAVERRS